MPHRVVDRLARERARKRRNSARYRRRFNAGQRVLRITVFPDRAQHAATKHGLLPPGEHSDADIAAALSLLIDEEGRS